VGIEIRSDSMFDSGADVLVNAVNCVGVSGIGLAADFKIRFPLNQFSYEKACKTGELKIGRIHSYKFTIPQGHKYIVNFPTKDHWRDPSQYLYIEIGMQLLVDWLNRHEDVESVSVPALGCGYGGLKWEKVYEIIHFYLKGIERDITVYIYPPQR